MNKKNKINWVSYLMHNFRITGLIIILLFVFGIFGFDKMAKSEFPDFVIRQGVVVAVYPGATAEEVEEQVAKPLERYLFTYDEVKRHKTNHHEHQRNVHRYGRTSGQRKQQGRGLEQD